jgi:hypothetical protein
MKKDKFVLLAHWGMDFDRTQWVSSTQATDGQYKTFLSNDLKDATYRNEKEAKSWAKEILKSPGASTWKIEVMPLEKAYDVKLVGQEQK